MGAQPQSTTRVPNTMPNNLFTIAPPYGASACSGPGSLDVAISGSLASNLE